MAADRKIEPKLAEAAAKTTAVLETLRSRLNREATPQEPAMEPPEVPDELGRQLERYFATAEPRSWGAPEGEIPASIKSEVIARLVEHVLGELLKKGATSR